LNIIRADILHLASVTPLFDAYRQFYGQAPNVSGASDFLRERLAKEESVIFLAVDQGRAQGFTQLYPSFSSVSMRRIWILYDLFVAPDARRHGIAGALLKHAQDFAAETKAEGLILETAVDNLAAQRLYEKLGWKRDAQFHRYAFSIAPDRA
jgi:ribosomal protein S18 acetylase RimI-like enzyme